MPVLVWVIHGRWRTIPWLAVGGIPVALVWGYLNWRLHGNPWTLGYSLLYGEEHGLGFHLDPYGEPFTPAVALSNAAVAIRRLHLYLFEWPIPALLPRGIWALLGRHRRIERFARHVAKRVPHGKVEVGIGHAICEEDAQLLEQHLRRLVPDIEKFVVTGLGPGIGVHGGPGTLLVSFRPWVSAQDVARRAN